MGCDTKKFSDDNMKFFLWIDGKQDGPFEPEQIRAMLGEGRIAAVTLGCPEDGTGEWKPISSYEGIVEPPQCSEPTPDPLPAQAPNPPPTDTSAKQETENKASPHQVEEVLFKESSVEESVVAMALTVVAALELIAAPIAGLVLGSDNTFGGVAIFIGGFTGGLILLGFAKVIDHSYEQAQRMRRIERLLLKASADKRPT